MGTLRDNMGTLRHRDTTRGQGHNVGTLRDGDTVWGQYGATTWGQRGETEARGTQRGVTEKWGHRGTTEGN